MSYSQRNVECDSGAATFSGCYVVDWGPMIIREFEPKDVTLEVHTLLALYSYEPIGTFMLMQVDSWLEGRPAKHLLITD